MFKDKKCRKITACLHFDSHNTLSCIGEENLGENNFQFKGPQTKVSFCYCGTALESRHMYRTFYTRKFTGTLKEVTLVKMNQTY